MTITAVSTSVLSVPLDQIRLPENVRELDHEHVEALAGSIKLRGLLVPVIVRAEKDGYCLVAGFHRFAAHKRLGLTEIRAEVRDVDADWEPTERAIENVTRKQLSPYEEALAVKDALAHGLTEDGAAQALGWPKARVTARTRLLELPERARRMVGAGEIPLSAVDQLRAIGKVSPPLLDAVIAYLADGNEWAAERLTREPGWVLDAALRETKCSVFAAYLSHLDRFQIERLKLGKRAGEQVEELERLHRQVDRYAYGVPPIRFTEADVDQARAAGVLIEFDHGMPIIADRQLYRQLAKGVIERAVGELREKAAAVAAEKKAIGSDRQKDLDPQAVRRRERDQKHRELAEQAHGVNLDLGASLMNGMAVVDPSDTAVARYFCYALLGEDPDRSPYGRSGERVAQLAVSGVRLVIEEFRSDVTRTRKDGSRGRLRISYGDPHEPEQPVAWLWKWLDGAKTAGELYGRTLVVIAAERYASRLVVPQSQRTHPTRWGSHKGLAERALEKLAGPYLPASLRRLEQAVKRAHSEYERAHHTASGEGGRAEVECAGQEHVAA